MKFVVYLTALLTLASCGNSTNDQSNDKVVKKETEETVKKEKELVEITVQAIGESMAEITYEPKSLSIPSNSRVKLTFENKSSAEGMYHNFVLVKLGSGSEIAQAGMTAGEENEFVPNDERVITHTSVVEMGGTVTIEFDAPEKGSYHYICTYPGHTNMIGRLNVE